MRYFIFSLSLALTLACSSKRSTGTPDEQQQQEPGCSGHADCSDGKLCVHGLCVAPPTGYGEEQVGRASLRASSAALDFGSVAADGSRTLPVTLTNDGEVVVELDAVRIEPAASTFRVEPLGHAPFWIRPGRARDVFVTYEPALGGANNATLTVESKAAPVVVTLTGH